MRTTLGLALALALVACKGGGLDNNGDGSAKGDLASHPGDDLAASQDFASNVDMAGVICGSMTCGEGVSCCASGNATTQTYACMDTCGDGGVQVSCDGPEDCNGNACCATIQLVSGSASGEAMCSGGATMCSSGSVDLQKQQITTKLCHNAGDCAGYPGDLEDYSYCCSYPNVSYKFCGPSFADGYNGITCTM